MRSTTPARLRKFARPSTPRALHQLYTFLSVRCALAATSRTTPAFPLHKGNGTRGQRPQSDCTPAPVAARALTGYRVMDTMFGALAQIVPHIGLRQARVEILWSVSEAGIPTIVTRLSSWI